MNRLLFADHLKWLRDAKIFPDASVDLVCLNPPFNSNADYKVLFREASGEASQAQFHPESVDAPRQLNPFVKAQREAKPEKTGDDVKHRKLVTAPGDPRNYPDAKKLVTEDCRKPLAIT